MGRPASTSKKPIKGEGVDATGGPVVDPTRNVLDLVEAANERQDDLRDLNNRYLDSELRRLEQTAILRSECAREMSDLRERHAREIGVAETNRLNAIRQVDQLAVSTAADRARAEIQTLAATTAANAETVRNLLTTTATTIAAQTARIETAITERLGALEKSSYSGAGKSAGISASWGILLGVVTLVIGLIVIGTFVFITMRPAAPQIIYTPAPAGTQLPSTPPATVPR